MSILQKYLHKLTHLNCATTTYGKAPHKPILLITIIELIENGHISDNKIHVDTDLVGLFQENWRLLVRTLNLPDFTQPFYYLQSEKLDGIPIWYLKPHVNCQINSYIKSINTLIKVVDFGYFKEDLYSLLADPITCLMLKLALLDRYFPETKPYYLDSKNNGNGYMHDLEEYVLNEPQTEYKTIDINTEEDIFVRGGLFKKLVPKVYNNTCCITGMRLESTYRHNFIDACHIIPFSITHDDKVNNGLALCPNLHRAFDRGLVSIDLTYKVEVSKHVNENYEHPYSLFHLNGMTINLPLNKQYYPSKDNLNWHRINIFKS